MPAHSRTVTEPSREIDIIHETDVLVVGSGPGGLAAAVAASRAGVRVALIERFGCFGGNITTVGVEGFAWYRHEQTVDAGGIGWEFEQRAKNMGAAVPESQSLSYELDSEGFKLVADRLVEEAGIHAMLHRQFVAPLMDGDTIIGVVTESKAGREAILARRVVDATGDADVATRAGAPVHKTPREEMMAASVMFHLAGVDKAAFLKGVAEDPQTYRDWAAGEFAAETDEKDADLYSPYLGKPFAKAIADGVLPDHLNTIGGTWGAMHDTGELTYMNLVHLAGCDGTDPDSLTHFEIEGRKQAMLAIEALRRYTPGCADARLRNFGMTIGIRDTRKIDAVYNLTESDVRGEGPVRRQHRDLPRVHRRIRRAGAADDRAVPADPVPVAAAADGPQLDRRRACHRRGPHRARSDPQHVVLRRHRSGCGRDGRRVHPCGPAFGRRGHLRGQGGAGPPGGSDQLITLDQLAPR
jgi:ribulose 1,5-bisphosphate synthetase/thiazole synthase